MWTSFPKSACWPQMRDDVSGAPPPCPKSDWPGDGCLDDSSNGPGNCIGWSCSHGSLRFGVYMSSMSSYQDLGDYQCRGGLGGQGIRLWELSYFSCNVSKSKGGVSAWHPCETMNKYHICKGAWGLWTTECPTKLVSHKYCITDRCSWSISNKQGCVGLQVTVLALKMRSTSELNVP